MALLEASHLSKTFVSKRSLLGRVTARFTAVDDVSFTLNEGETLSLVGESGAGKSTTGRLVLRLIEPDAGEIMFDGVNVRRLPAKDLRGIRRKMQMIFQDPFSSLDPHVPVIESVAEPLLVHFGTERRERLKRAAELFDRVGLGTATYERYPAELSGGQLQRIAIARALTLEPKLIVCDEPVAALDVSVRAQVLNLMRELQLERGIAYLFISHDLALVEVISDRVAVMSKGAIVEVADAEQIYKSPQHEYTKALLSAIPVPVPKSLRK
ncbi:MAG: ATP-binding cassette domain-containing protein [Acidimicrobiia bacterium]